MLSPPHAGQIREIKLFVIARNSGLDLNAPVTRETSPADCLTKSKKRKLST